MFTKNEPSQRQIRFSEVIRGIISDTIKKNSILNDEIELGSVTISFVNLSRNLRIASIYIMPLAGHKKEKILDLINENKHIFCNHSRMLKNNDFEQFPGVSTNLYLTRNVMSKTSELITR